MSGQRKIKRASVDTPEANYNPSGRTYWTEGQEGRKSGSKVPPTKRKAKRRKK